MTFPDYCLEAEGLGCRRGTAAIFEGVTFTLPPGGLLAVRGPNGSGKSSLLRILCGLMNPSAGAARLAIGALAVEEVARHAHYLGHLSAVTTALSVTANLAYQAALLGSGNAAVAPALARVGLETLALTPARHLSAGQRRRLALARLIAVPRPLWLLDEPAESLDAQGEALLAEISQAHRAAGGLIVVATHALPLRATAELVLKPAEEP